MKTKNWNRLLSLILALAMVFSMAPPISAAATDGETASTEETEPVAATTEAPAEATEAGEAADNSENAVAKIGGNTYATLADAISAAETGATIQLLDSIDLGSGYVTIDKGLTLDLCGKTITSTACYALYITGSVILTDSSETAGTIQDVSASSVAPVYGTGDSSITVEKVNIVSYYDAYAGIYTCGNLTVNSGDIFGWAGIYANGATVTVNGGTIHGYNCGIDDCDGSTVTVNGGTVCYDSSQYAAAASGINVIGNNTDLTQLIVNDGANISGYGYGIATNGSASYGYTSITINGGTISAVNGGMYLPAANSTTTITGGEISGYCGIGISNGTLNISGGTITGTAEDSELDDSYTDSGLHMDGSAIVLAASYGNVDVNISGGTIKSDCSYAIRGYYRTNATTALTTAVAITGGTVTSGTSMTSDIYIPDGTSYENVTIEATITGGTFSSDVSAYVAEDYTQCEDGEVVSDYAAMVNNSQKYNTLAGAINAVEDNTETTITLLADVTEDVVIPNGKNITLDLNSHSITNASGHTITVDYGAVLTITGTGTVDNTTHGKGAVVNYGTAYLYGGTFTRSAEKGASSSDNGGNSWYTIKNYNQMTIGNGTDTVTVENSGCYSSCVANGYQNASDKTSAQKLTGEVTPTLSINAGASISGGIATIKNDDNAKLTINGGTFTNEKGMVIQNHSTATIAGGTFTGSTYAVYNCGCDATDDVGSLTISGGTFSGIYALADVSTANTATVTVSAGSFTGTSAAIGTSSGSTAKISISGGTYSSAVAYKYCADGYLPTAADGGTYSVAEGTAIASITADGATTYYTAFTDAVAAANQATSDVTIKLLADVTVDEGLTISKSLMLDLNGNDLTINNGVSLTIDTGAEVSIMDSSEDATGIVYNYGSIAVNGSLDISDLGYTTSTSSGGLYGQTNGKIAMGASGTFVVPDAWAAQWSSLGAWTPNWTSATSGSGIFSSAEVGATVVSSDTFWQCTTAFASSKYDSGVTYWTNLTACVATVTDYSGNITYYETLADAAKYASSLATGSSKNETTITLLRDVTLTERVALENAGTSVRVYLTLDLDGHTITADVQDGYGLYIKSTDTYGYGKITVQNGTIQATANAYGAIEIDHGAAILTSLTLTSQTAGHGTILVDSVTGSNAEFTDLTITTTDGYCLEVNNSSNTAALKLSGKQTYTQIASNDANESQLNACVYLHGSTGMSASAQTGSEINWSSDGYGVYISGNRVYFNKTVSGKIEGKTKGIYVDSSYTNSNDAVTVVAASTIAVDGGVESAASAYDNYAIAISGGNYEYDLNDAYVASGYECVLDSDSTSDTYGRYIIQEVYVAEVYNGDTLIGSYNSLSGAISAATSGYTVKLIKDCSGSSTITISKNLTIDLNGNTYAYTGSSNAFTLNNSNYTVTITDTGNSDDGGKIEAMNSNAIAIVVKRGTLNVEGKATISASSQGIQLGGYSSAYSSSIKAVVNVKDNATVYGGETGVGIYGSTSSSATANSYGPSLNVVGGTVKGGYYGIAGNGSTTYKGNTFINVSSGTVEGDVAIYNPQAGTVTISDDAVINGTTSGVQMCSGDLIVTGGSITVTAGGDTGGKEGDGSIPDGAAVSVVNRSYPGGTPTATISGGTFKSASGVSAVQAYTWSSNTVSDWTDAGTYINISGGYYSGDVTEYCAVGYEATYDDVIKMYVIEEVQNGDYCFGQTVQIRLVEPWGLKANVRIYTDAATPCIDYNSLTDYGVYFIRASEVTGTGTAGEVTAQDIISDEDAVHYTKSGEQVTVDGNYLTAIYDSGLYTYEMTDSVYVLFYIVVNEDIYYAPVRERNIKNLLDERKTNDAFSEYERAVYAAMSELNESVTAYRAQFSDLTAPEVTVAPTMSTVSSQFSFTTPSDTDTTYSFGNTVQLKVIEPWGMKFNARVYNAQNTVSIDYSSLDDYGAIVYYDLDGTYSTVDMTQEKLLSLNGAYVYSKTNGLATIDGSYISVVFDNGVYTYQLDTNVYVMFFVKDSDGYHYGAVKTRNVYSLATERMNNSSYGDLECAVYSDMVDMYDAVKAYRSSLSD